MEKRVIITGATGLIGRKLAARLFEEGCEVYAIARNEKSALEAVPTLKGTLPAGLSPAKLSGLISGAEAVFSLAGAPIGSRRWTPEYKSEILRSRVDITRLLSEAIKLAPDKPGLFCSVSAVGYYGDRGDEPLIESSGHGTGFLAEVCRQWEAAALEAEAYTRLVVLRLGIVLSGRGGALGKLAALFQKGLGGTIGSGEQWMAWIHEDDLVELFLHVMDNHSVGGVFNAVSPGAVKNRDFTKKLSKALGRPVFLRIPGGVVKMMEGERAVIALSSQKALPGKIIKSGFKFKHETLESALGSIFEKKTV